jgi:hypothetical protein
MVAPFCWPVLRRPFSTVAPHILFLGVHAIGDGATWPPERHSQERSR